MNKNDMSRIFPQIFDSSQRICANFGPGNVIILTGLNGSGKSFILQDAIKNLLKSNEHVIAISNTLIDKLPIKRRDSKYEKISHASGKSCVNTLIKKVLQTIEENEYRKVNFIRLALEYLSFDPRIGIEILGVDFDVPKIKIGENENAETISNAIDLLRKFEFSRDYKQVHWVEVSSYRNEIFSASEIGELISYEPILKKHRLIKSIKLYLARDGERIPLLAVSSGELSLFLLICHIGINIKEGSIIVIDEPENSLHISRQQKYLQSLFDVFHYMRPSFMVATHSPFIISSASNSPGNVDIYIVEDFFAKQIMHSELASIEAQVYEYFGVLTPQNHYFSVKIIRCINDLNSKKITREQYNLELTKYLESTQDEKQIAIIQKLLRMKFDEAEKYNVE